MPTPEMRLLRSEIDAVDDQLLDLLAKRFAIVDRVIAEKRRANLSPALPDRIEQVAKRVRAGAELRGLPAASLENVWRLLVSETIRYEEQALGSRAAQKE
jgi:isochorismate pyruvate lyase